MSYCSVNGKTVMSADIRLALTGTWTADLVVDSQVSSGLTGQVVIQAADSLSWTGSVYRAGTFTDSIRMRVVGGGGGLGKILPAIAYGPTPMRIPVADVLASSGEKLSARADQAALALMLPKWTRMEQRASECLSLLVEQAGLRWRVLNDGTIWFGPELWPPATIDYDSIDSDPRLGWEIISSDVPDVSPGQTLDGRRVLNVAHHFEAEHLRTTVYYQ